MQKGTPRKLFRKRDVGTVPFREQLFHRANGAPERVLGVTAAVSMCRPCAVTLLRGAESDGTGRNQPGGTFTSGSERLTGKSLSRLGVARSLLAEVSFESVASDVERALRALDLDDLGTEAGMRRSGGRRDDAPDPDIVLHEVLPRRATQVVLSLATSV